MEKGENRLGKDRKIKRAIKYIIAAILIVTSFIAGFIVGKAEARRSLEIEPTTDTYRVEINTTRADENGFNTYISTNIKYLENDENCGGLHIRGTAVPLEDKE